MAVGWALLFVTSWAASQTQQVVDATPASAPAEAAQPAAPTPVLSPQTPEARGFALRTLGVRGSAVSTRAAGRDEQWSGGGELYERGVGVLRLDFWSGRYFDELWIGYGSEGWRYQLSGQLGFGAIALLDKDQGVAARLALRGQMRREGGLYASELRLPGAELGYFWSRGNRQLEILGHVGTTLTGRFNPEGQTRELRGLTYGSSLSVSLSRLRLDADVSQVAASAEAGAVLEARAHLCAHSQDRWGGRRSRRGEATPPPPPAWAICGDFRALRGRVEDVTSGLDEGPGDGTAQQVVWGVSVTFGQLAHL
jgi:hypothetical protein